MNNKILSVMVLGTFLSIITQVNAGYFPNQNRQSHGPNPQQKQFSNQQTMPWSQNQSGKATDSQITSRIKDSLQKGSTDYNDTVTFEVENGRVLLTGQVDTITDLELIEERINGINEITALENRIEIKPERNPNTRWHRRDYEQVESVKQRY